MYSPHLRPTQDELCQPLANQRNITDDARAHGDRPKRKLIPGQQIPREVCTQHQQEHGNADQPVQFTRRPVGTGDEHADQMQHRHHDQQIRTPMVQVADQFPKPDIEFSSRISRYACGAAGV